MQKYCITTPVHTYSICHAMQPYSVKTPTTTTFNSKQQILIKMYKVNIVINIIIIIWKNEKRRRRRWWWITWHASHAHLNWCRQIHCFYCQVKITLRSMFNLFKNNDFFDWKHFFIVSLRVLNEICLLRIASTVHNQRDKLPF